MYVEEESVSVRQKTLLLQCEFATGIKDQNSISVMITAALAKL